MLVKLVFDDLGEFVRSYRGHISRDGMLLLCADELPRGATVELVICLSDGLELVRGRAGVVASHRVARSEGPAQVVGLGFIQLEDESQSLIRRLTERHQNEGVPPFILDAVVSASEAGVTIGELARLDLPYAQLEDSTGATAAFLPQSPSPSSSQASAEFQQQPRTDWGDASEAKPSIAVRAGLVSPPNRREGLSRMIAIGVLALVTAAVAVVVAVLFFPDMVGLHPANNDFQTAEIPPPTSSPASAAAEATSPPAPAITPAEISTETTAAPTVPASSPTPSPTTSAPATGARQVLRLSWSEDESESVVTVECDQELRQGQLSHFRIADQDGPRHVFKIAGIQASRIPYTSRIDGRRLAAVRSWHHTEKQPAELHLVVDFNSPSVRFATLERVGSRLVLRFSEH